MAYHYYRSADTACLLTIAFSSILRKEDDSINYHQKDTFIPGAFDPSLPFEENEQRAPA